MTSVARQRAALNERAASAAARAVPETLFGLDLRPQSLPADLLGIALAAWHSGAHERALSLLYRGALALIVGKGTDVPASATEGECVALVAARLGEPVGSDFAELTSAWQ